MAYDPLLPTDRDWVRFWIGDTDAVSPILRDAELDAILTAEGGNKYLAAYAAGMAIYMRKGGLVEKQVGDLRLKYSESHGQTYLNHLRALRERGIAGLRQTEFRVV